MATREALFCFNIYPYDRLLEMDELVGVVQGGEAAGFDVVTFADHGPQRKNTETVPYNGCPDNPPALDKDCDGVPDSEYGEVQPAFGAGPTWLGRLVTEPAK